jgi:3D (Asp-Asp-Asp) domain-containing protein
MRNEICKYDSNAMVGDTMGFVLGNQLDDILDHQWEIIPKNS